MTILYTLHVPYLSIYSNSIAGIIGQSIICVHADNVSNELPEIVFGTYVNDASREKNFTDIAAVFRKYKTLTYSAVHDSTLKFSLLVALPDGISWKSDSRMWFGKQNNEYVAKYIVDLVYTFAFPFKLNEPRNTTFQGVPVQVLNCTVLCTCSIKLRIHTVLLLLQPD